MTCHDAREWLSDLVDDGLEPDRRAEVEAHLATCAECRLELGRLRATVAVLRRVERPRAPARFVEGVMQRVQSIPWSRRVAAWLFLPLSVKLPAQAAAIVVIAGLAMLVFERTPELRDAARLESAPAQKAPAEAPTQPAPRSPSDSGPRPSRARQTPPPSPPAPTEPEAREAPGEKVASAPPAQEAKRERELREGPPVSPPPLAAGETRARSAPQAVRRAMVPAEPLSDLAGRLSVKDRAAAGASVVDLLSRLGGREVARRQDASDTVIEVLVPSARYDEFIRGLEALGSWTAAGRPNILPLDPPQIRMTVRLTE